MAFATLHPQEAMLQPTTFEILGKFLLYVQPQTTVIEFEYQAGCGAFGVRSRCAVRRGLPAAKKGECEDVYIVELARQYTSRFYG